MSIFAAIELSKMTVMQKIERDHMTYALSLQTKTDKYLKMLENNNLAQAQKLYGMESTNFKDMGILQIINQVKAQPAKIYEITILAERMMFTMLGFGNAFTLADKGLEDSKEFLRIVKQINSNPTEYKQHQIQLLNAMREIKDNGIKFAPIVADASNFVSFTMSSMIVLAILFLLSFLYFAKKDILNNINMFEHGLLDFFDFLSGKTSKATEITIQTKDEVNDMAQIINKQIINAQKRFNEDSAFIADTQEVMARVGNGWFAQYIQAPTNNKSLHHLKTTINDALKNLNSRFDIINKAFEYNKKEDNKEIVTGNMEVDAILFLKEFSKKYPKLENELKEKLKKWGGNSAGRNLVNIDYKGNIKPDPFFPLKIGNIFTESFEKVWMDKENALLKKLREFPRKLKGKCKDCEYIRICNGGSRPRAWAIYSDLWEEDPSCYKELIK
jgi:radical SAM protein with 4Fe4S-binding SPASM domain